MEPVPGRADSRVATIRSAGVAGGLDPAHLVDLRLVVALRLKQVADALFVVANLARESRAPRLLAAAVDDVLSPLAGTKARWG